MTYVSNNRSSYSNNTGAFQIEQRNAGFVQNDGRWIAHQDGEYYWSAGLLKRRRAGRHLGDFATREAAIAACDAAERMPELPRLAQFI